jgi:hypothetical protein
MAFAASLPRAKPDIFSDQWKAKYCPRCINKAFHHTHGTKSEKQYRHLAEYFVDQFLKLNNFEKNLVIDPLLGVLDGLSLDGTSGLYQRLARMNPQSAKN